MIRREDIARLIHDARTTEKLAQVNSAAFGYPPYGGAGDSPSSVTIEVTESRSSDEYYTGKFVFFNYDNVNPVWYSLTDLDGQDYNCKIIPLDNSINLTVGKRYHGKFEGVGGEDIVTSMSPYPGWPIVSVGGGDALDIRFPAELFSTYDDVTGYSWTRLGLDITVPGFNSVSPIPVPVPQSGTYAFEVGDNQQLVPGTRVLMWKSLSPKHSPTDGDGYEFQLVKTGCGIINTPETGYSVDVATLAGTHLTTEIIPDEEQDDSDSTDGPCLRLAVDLTYVPGCNLKLQPGDPEALPPIPDKLAVDVPSLVGNGLILQPDPDPSDNIDICDKIGFPLDAVSEITIGPFVTGVTLSRDGCLVELGTLSQTFTLYRNQDGVLVSAVQGPSAPISTVVGIIDLRDACECCPEIPSESNWKCNEFGTCTEDATGQFATEAQCLAECVDEWNPANCNCDCHCDTYTVTDPVTGVSEVLTRVCCCADCTDEGGAAVWKSINYYLYYNGNGWGLVSPYTLDDNGCLSGIGVGGCNWRYDDPIDSGCATFTVTTACPAGFWDTRLVCCGSEPPPGCAALPITVYATISCVACVCSSVSVALVKDIGSNPLTWTSAQFNTCGTNNMMTLTCVDGVFSLDFATGFCHVCDRTFVSSNDPPLQIVFTAGSCCFCDTPGGTCTVTITE